MNPLRPILWQPSNERLQNSQMMKFMCEVNHKFQRHMSSYKDLYGWSITDLGNFWQAVADFTKIKWHKQAEQVYLPPKPGCIRGAKWFVGAKLNFAENLLLPGDDDKIIISSYAEGCAEIRHLGKRDMLDLVGQCARALKKLGVQKGDRVVGVVANVAEAIIAMLATTSLGAIWSSCSPDFGAKAILDRFQQITPKVLFFTHSYVYRGKYFNCAQQIAECARQLKTVIKTVVINHLDQKEHQGAFVSWQDFLNETPRALDTIEFMPVEFEHPVYILFSSGTTGSPKCIVHGCGGTLLQHKKELSLHCDIAGSDSLLYYTTSGWMMWNWMVSALSLDCRLVLYEGAVNEPDLTALWKFVDRHKVTVFGTSPKFIGSCRTNAISPHAFADFTALRTILSTGSPLLPEHFDWVYTAVKRDVHLASISGGTDIISCFALGNPLLPVRKGEIQAPGLGMAVEAWDSATKKAVMDHKGELVCVKPFVSMPVMFWNDPDGQLYKKAYFEHFKEPEVWRHGDYIEVTAEQGIIIYGRSDATLNPGGVRIGTAEIYRQVESCDAIEDSLAVGWETDGEERIILFVKLKNNKKLTEGTALEIKQLITNNLSPRHVPHHILAVNDIPYTRSGKKIELAVHKILRGEEIDNRGAIANPEVLMEYKKYRQFLAKTKVRE